MTLNMFANINDHYFSFSFEHDGRVFDMMTKMKEEADLWVACLKLLSEVKKREQESLMGNGGTLGSDSYFHTLKNTIQLHR